MRILFCKISSMKYYKGVCPKDSAVNGGSFVKENGFGHEEFNFLPMSFEGEDKDKCFGFFEPKSNSGKRNTVHIERIYGCAAMKNEPCIDDVLVVWCATDYKSDFTVVGWYKHAMVFRDLQGCTFNWCDGTQEERCYNVLADAENCTLLPEKERNVRVMHVPIAKRKGYGFGQSMVWYPTEESAQPYLKELAEAINNYNSENWLNEFPE